MQSKSITESKTIIVNTIVALAIFIDYMTGANVGQWLQDVTGAANVELAVLAIINVVLRFWTNRPVAIGG